MEIVKLTNIGYLTLQHLLELDDKYKENSTAKKKKIANLWSSPSQMDDFMTLFAGYMVKEVSSVITKEDDEIFLQHRELPNHKLHLTSRDWGNRTKQFEEMGLVTSVPETLMLEETLDVLKEERDANPARNINRVVIELTGACNLKCKHCYRGGSRPGEYGIPVETIKKGLEPLLRAGIRSIMITGGEPTLRRDDLIEVIDYASQFMELQGVSEEERLIFKYGKNNLTVEEILKRPYYVRLKRELSRQLTIPESQLIPGDWNICNENTMEDIDELIYRQAASELKNAGEASYSTLDNITVLSNGFFDEPRELVKYLKSRHVALQTSLDSFNGHRTNQNRRKAGVFGRIKNLVVIAKEEGLNLSITGHNIGGAKTVTEKKNGRYFDRNAQMVVLEGMHQMGNATGNGFDAGNIGRTNNYLGSLKATEESGEGWCTGWTSPKDIHLKPTGNVGNCLYAYAVPEELGNLKRMPMTDIINGIQETLVYKMFMDGRIERYQHELDQSLFPAKFRSSCEPMVLTLTYAVVKERLIEQGVDNPVEKANREVARMYKYTV